MKKYVTFFDLNKNCFILTLREIEGERFGLLEIKEGLIKKNQIFDKKLDAIKSLKNSNFIEIL